ncbi:hypothetical protein VPH35_103971 [Triticum aestivum]
MQGARAGSLAVAATTRTSSRHRHLRVNRPPPLVLPCDRHWAALRAGKPAPAGGSVGTARGSIRCNTTVTEMLLGLYVTATETPSRSFLIIQSASQLSSSLKMFHGNHADYFVFGFPHGRIRCC